jgi:hypothetical protein
VKQYYRVYATFMLNSEPIMVAPMFTIERVFGLHETAVQRILRELETAQSSECHFNGRKVPMMLNGIRVEKARHSEDV